MRISMSYSAVSTVMALCLIMLSYRSCRATYGDQCCASCGGHNVSHPFRLQHYPDACGDKRYNLSCEHNQLVLYLKSGRYKVVSINYDNYTIRVRDANVVEFDYSSLPRDSLTHYNFSRHDPYTVSERRSGGLLYLERLQNRLSKLMIYASCKHAVINSSVLVDTTPCVEASNGSAVSSSSTLHIHLYANVGSQYIGDLGLEDDCRVELMCMTSWPALERHTHNHSYRDIHSMLVYGFELSWLSSFCHRHSAHLDYRDKPRCKCIKIITH